MKKTLLHLDSLNAKKFFLDQRVYTTIDLPPYFLFSKMLSDLSAQLGTATLSSNELAKAKKLDDVNHIIYDNKDGKYAWRRFKLINPYIYLSLVNILTEETAWRFIRLRMEQLQSNPSILCGSFPALPKNNQSQKASQVKEWIEKIEKESLVSALEFEYLYETDIADCYGSIYTHSLSWALHDKHNAKKNRGDETLLGNKIDHHLQAISYGQTNGIPQGSVLMNFIAEIVLAYADSLLTESLDKNINRDEYKILRYRDDYKIFVRNSYHGEIIMKTLSETLANIGMSLSTVKTKKSDKIIVDSIKPDKFSTFYYFQSDYKKINTYSLQKELLITYHLGINYPNSGSIKRRLDIIDQNVPPKVLQSNHKIVIAILINIAIDSPSSFPLVASLISKAIVKLKTGEKQEIFQKLYRKINMLPNSGLLEVWLQRITLAHNIPHTYKEKLCTMNRKTKVKLYNNEWISSKTYKDLINNANIFDKKSIANLDILIGRKEVELFTPY